MDNVGNKFARKRKSTYIFNNLDVDEVDCSPSNSLESQDANDGILLCETEVSQTSSDISANRKMLTQENNIAEFETLKPVDLQSIDTENSSPVVLHNNRPFISLAFRDNKFANIFKSRIVDFIQSLVNFELSEESECANETITNLWDYRNLDQQIVESSSIKEESFVVDTTPSKCLEILPKYIANHSNVIEHFDLSIKTVDENSASCRARSLCFNCDGDHSMKTCSEMKDYRRIGIARNKYMASAQGKSVRYHLDDEQKYKHLVPGRISEKLRKALDIRKHELPTYIYRMRMFGYPPGWLQEAMVTTSKLQLFDYHGCAVEKVGADTKIIDASQVVDYPGFNVPLEKGCKDDYKYYRCPPYSDDFSKNSMLEYIERNRSEILENNRHAIDDTPSKCEELDRKDQEIQGPDQEQKQRSASPTLIDLELRKRQLLAELGEGSTGSPLSISKNNEKQGMEVSLMSEDTIESRSVVSSTFGTPILKTGSVYCELPDRDKWSKDISQVINFENLPDATGKYEQMNKVIGKVRNVVKNIFVEDKDKS